MRQLFTRMLQKEDPSVYEDKDSHLKRVLGVKDFF